MKENLSSLAHNLLRDYEDQVTEYLPGHYLTQDRGRTTYATFEVERLIANHLKDLEVDGVPVVDMASFVQQDLIEDIAFALNADMYSNYYEASYEER